MSTSNPDFGIRDIQKIPPGKFSFIDSLLIAVGIMVTLNFVVANVRVSFTGKSLNEVIIAMSTVDVLIYNLLFVAFLCILFLRSAIKLTLDKVGDADQFLEFLIQKFQLKDPHDTGDEIIFKPTRKNILMGVTQNVRVSLKDNSVTISGSFLMLHRLKNLLKPYKN